VRNSKPRTHELLEESEQAVFATAKSDKYWVTDPTGNRVGNLPIRSVASRLFMAKIRLCVRPRGVEFVPAEEFRGHNAAFPAAKAQPAAGLLRKK